MNFVYRVLVAALAIVCEGAGAAVDGSYDPSFGNGGRESVDVTDLDSDAARVVRALPDGTLFVAGGCLNLSSGTPGVTCAAWINPDGSLALGYGPSGSGKVRFDEYTGWPTDGILAYDARRLGDGRLAVVIGTSSGQPGYLVAVKADGSGLDPAVGNGAGYVQLPTIGTSIAIRPNGKLVIGGSVVSSSTSVPIVIAQYRSDFTLDADFGDQGLATVDFTLGGSPTVTDHVKIALQRDGKVLAITTIFGATSGSELAIARVTENGRPDSAFGINSDGRYHSNFGASYTSGSSVLEDARGRIVFAGNSPDDTINSPWLVGRLLGGGAVDPAFNAGHPQQFLVLPANTGGGQSTSDLVLQSDGRILVTGRVDRAPDSATYYFGVARLLDNGSLDGSFGLSGVSYGGLSDAPDSQSDYPASMVMADGGLVIAGFTTVASGETRFSLSELTIDLIFADGYD
ncbi:MAG TPA: hypothetical protein VGC30_02080 [Dokdonella sp.]